MPRTTSVTSPYSRISIRNLSIDSISGNDCLGATFYVKGLHLRTWNILEQFYKIQVDREKQTLSLEFKNSWKGMVHFLLALLYFENGNKIVIMQADYKFVTSVHVDRDFKLLQSEVKPDKCIEKLYVPESYQPMYAISTYSNRKILDALQQISNALNIDITKSLITCNPSPTKDNPRLYKKFPVFQREDTSNKLCRILTTATGTAFVEHNTMKDLLNDAILMILFSHPLHSFSEAAKLRDYYSDCVTPPRFLAYPILRPYTKQLKEYFPFYTGTIEYYAQKTSLDDYGLDYSNFYLETGCGYVLVDFVKFGYWG